MYRFINNNKGMLSLWLILALFFSLMPNRALGKEGSSVLAADINEVSKDSKVDIEISTGSAIAKSEVKISTGSGLKYNGKKQNLVKKIDVRLDEKNNNFTKETISIAWRTEAMQQATYHCPPLKQEDWEAGVAFKKNISPMLNAGYTALYCKISDKNNNIIATGSAVASIDKLELSYIWTGDTLLYSSGDYQAPDPNIEDEETKEIVKNDKTILKVRVKNILRSSEIDIKKTDRMPVGKYRAEVEVEGDKKENYTIAMDEKQSVCNFTVVPQLKKDHVVVFEWGKKWGTEEDLKEVILCDKKALKEIRLSHSKEKYIRKSGKQIWVGKKKWKGEINTKKPVSFSLKLDGVSWKKKLNGYIKFPGLSVKNMKKSKIVKRIRTGNKCKYVFKYNIKKKKWASRIFVTINGVKKNKKSINAVLKKYVGGRHSNGKESYLILTYPNKKKARKSKVSFEISIMYGQNRSDKRTVCCYEKNNKSKYKYK